MSASQTNRIGLSIAAATLWVAILASVALSTGCTATIGHKPTPDDALVQTQATITAAANTLADAADAGIIDRGSKEYAKLKTALIDARDALDFAWEAMLTGKPGEAEQWRRMALDSYAKVRPRLIELQKQGEK